MIFKSPILQKRLDHKLATTTITNEIVDALNGVTPTPASGAGITNLAPGRTFIGVIVTAGPHSEANYTDNRYWVKFQYIASGGPYDRATTGDTTLVMDLGIVTVTNLAEAVSGGGAGTHKLATNSYVAFHVTSDVGGTARFIMTTGGGSGTTAVVKISSATSGNGEYNARIFTGVATGMPPAGMTDPGSDNALVEYLPEASTATHSLAAGSYHVGIVVGVSSGLSVVAVDTGGAIPLGSLIYQVYQMTSGSTAGWDYPKFHG